MLFNSGVAGRKNPFLAGFEPWTLWQSSAIGSHLSTTWGLRVKPRWRAVTGQDPELWFEDIGARAKVYMEPEGTSLVV